MGKSYRWERFGEDPRLRHYKWEFLRRNEEYQKDYAAFEERFSEWLQRNGGWVPRVSKDEDPEAWAFFRSQVVRPVGQILQRWGISDPVNPAQSFEYPHGSGSESMLLLHFSKSSDFTTKDDIDTKFLEPELSEEEKERITDSLLFPWDHAPQNPQELRFIKVRIDIAKTLDSIFERLERDIERARLRYRVQVGPLPDFRKRQRIRLDQYDSYLKVWDLRMQDLTFEEIAFLLFPREMENPAHRCAVTKRVRSQFQRARALIYGGYRQIEG